jgi:hypothetical protein
LATPAASAEVSVSVHALDALRGVVAEDLAFLLLALACESSERRTGGEGIISTSIECK